MVSLIDRLIYDAKFALRALLSNRRFCIIALSVIGVTVAGVTTVFTLVHSILLKPLPYPDAGRLVTIGITDGAMAGNVSLPDFLDLQRESRALEILAGYRNSVFVFNQDTNRPYPVTLSSTTPELFSLLGIEPMLGRRIIPEDALPETAMAAVLSYELCQTLFGGTVDVLGKTVRLPRRLGAQDMSVQLTVVGVMPPKFTVPFSGGRLPVVWTAMRPAPDDTDRSSAYTVAIGRLRKGVSLQEARTELLGISQRRDRTIALRPVLERVVSNSSEVLWVFLGSVGCVFLMGVVNLANLQMVRYTARMREFSIRTALGAGRARMIRQVLLESLWLGVFGGAIGLPVAAAATDWIRGVQSIRLPRADEISMDLTVYLCTLGLSVLSGLLIAVLPALRICRAGPSDLIHDGGFVATPGKRLKRTQQFFIGFQTAAALVLLVGALLLINSFWRLFTEETGMREDNLWSIQISFPRVLALKGMEFWKTTLETMRAMPGVESAGLAIDSGAPLQGRETMAPGVRPYGGDSGLQSGILVSLKTVSADYFKTLGLALIRGRSFDDRDSASTERVAILNERAAQMIFSNTSVLDRQVAFNSDVFTIVGVVPNFKDRALNADVAPQMYAPDLQDRTGSAGSALVMLRLKPEQTKLIPAATAAIHGMDREAQLVFTSMLEIRWNALAAERFRTSVMTLFAGTGIGLAVIGLAGIVSYTVVQRRREIGLLIALGADPQKLSLTILRQTLQPVLFGIAVGGLVSIWAAKFLRSYLYKLAPTDTTSFVIAAVALLAASAIAILLPARRTARVDPMIVLRHE